MVFPRGVSHSCGKGPGPSDDRPFAAGAWSAAPSTPGLQRENIMSLIRIGAVLRPLAMVAIMLPLALASATAMADTFWHGWTYIDSGGNTQFNKLVVSFANTGGGVAMRQVATTSIPGVAIANAPPNGYTLDWPVATPFKKGETITAQFDAPAATQFLGATAFNDAVVVGMIDSQGILNADGLCLSSLALRSHQSRTRARDVQKTAVQSAAQSVARTGHAARGEIGGPRQWRPGLAFRHA
jgi:hypothetical protein